MKKLTSLFGMALLAFVASAADPCITNITFKATEFGICSNSFSVPLVLCEGVRVPPDTNGVYVLKIAIANPAKACLTATTSITIGYDKDCCLSRPKVVGKITYYIQGSPRTNSLVMPAGRHVGTWVVGADSYGPLCNQSYLFSELCYSTPCNEVDEE